MKKQLIFLTSILIVNICFSQKIYISDANFEQALIDLGYDDAPLDQYVITSEIENIIELDVSSKEISSLEGLAGFKNLRSLSCSANQLSSIDLRQNKELEELYIDSNQLVTIDLRQNKKLVSLDISNNFLRNLDTRENTILYSLVAYNNKLEKVKLENKITDTLIYFDAIDNPKLICIQQKNNNINNYWIVDFKVKFKEICDFY